MMKEQLRRTMIGFVAAVLIMIIAAPSFAQKLSKDGDYWVTEIENTYNVSRGGMLEMVKIVGDVDVQRIEFHQRFDGVVQPLDAVSFHRRQQLKGEEGIPGFFDSVNDLHETID